MDHQLSPAAQAVAEHYRTNFAGRKVEVHAPVPGPTPGLDLHILVPG